MYNETAQSRDWTQPIEASPTPPDGLVAANQKLDALTNHAYQITHIICEHADRILGARPETEGKVGPSPIRGGALGSLHDHLDRLETALQRLDEQSRRFSAV